MTSPLLRALLVHSSADADGGNQSCFGPPVRWRVSGYLFELFAHAQGPVRVRIERSSRGALRGQVVRRDHDRCRQPCAKFSHPPRRLSGEPGTAREHGPLVTVRLAIGPEDHVREPPPTQRLPGAPYLAGPANALLVGVQLPISPCLWRTSATWYLYRLPSLSAVAQSATFRPPAAPRAGQLGVRSRFAGSACLAARTGELAQRLVEREVRVAGRYPARLVNG